MLKWIGIAVLCWVPLQPVYAFKDPTEPPVDLNFVKKEKVVQTHFVTTAIFIEGNKRYAIINDTLVKPGDKIEKREVKRIDPYSVILSIEQDDEKENLEKDSSGEGGEMTLYLLGSEQSIRKETK